RGAGFGPVAPKTHRRMARVEAANPSCRPYGTRTVRCRAAEGTSIGSTYGAGSPGMAARPLFNSQNWELTGRSPDAEARVAHGRCRRPLAVLSGDARTPRSPVSLAS